MKFNRIILTLLCLSVLIFKHESTASVLIIKSDTKLKDLKIGEHTSVKQPDVFVGSNVIELVNYPNAVYFYVKKPRNKYNFLAMVWFETDTSTVHITLDKDLNVIFDDESLYQSELTKIFKASNIWSLFPYEPQDDKPLKPILALEAKLIIQNLETDTERSVLTNLLKLSHKRGIDNWSTDVLSAYLKEPSKNLYDTGKLTKIIGLDSLENQVIIKPNEKYYYLLAVSGSWCGPCVKGIPKLRESYDAVSERVLFISLWNDPNLETFRDFHREKKKFISWPNLWDKYGLMANALGISEYPSYILFDPLGNEVKRWNGKFPNDLKKYTSN